MTPTIVLITDPRWPFAHLTAIIEAVARALPSGALAVQLRDKAAAPDALARSARALRTATERAAAVLTINAPDRARLDVARDVAADGVHVPLGLVAEARQRFAHGWISAPAHADEDVSRAAEAGVTAVLVSPIWPTPGKAAPRGVGAIASARARATDRLAIYALGGVDAARAEACATAGADGVAVIRALLDHADPARAAAEARCLHAPFG